MHVVHDIKANLICTPSEMVFFQCHCKCHVLQTCSNFWVALFHWCVCVNLSVTFFFPFSKYPLNWKKQYWNIHELYLMHISMQTQNSKLCICHLLSLISVPQYILCISQHILGLNCTRETYHDRNYGLL